MGKEFREHHPSSAQHVVGHGLYKKSRGKNPSLPFMGIRNPLKAFSEAQRILDFMDNPDNYGTLIQKFHPERQPGEIYIGSFRASYISEGRIRWQSIRIGKTAYMFDGTPAVHDWLFGDHYFPVFAQEQEIRSLMYGEGKTPRLKRRFKVGDEVTWTLEGGTWNDYLREDYGIGPFKVSSAFRNSCGDPIVYLNDSSGLHVKSNRECGGAFPECYLRNTMDFVNMIEPRHTTIGRNILLT